MVKEAEHGVIQDLTPVKIISNEAEGPLKKSSETVYPFPSDFVIEVRIEKIARGQKIGSVSDFNRGE